jgi:hypothetical protein
MYQRLRQLIHRQVAPALTAAPAPPIHMGAQTYQGGSRMVSAADRATGPDRGRLGGLPDRGRLGGPPGTAECRSHESTSDTPSVIACPECGLPAEITEQFSLSSTDGPVEHVALACVDGHYFRMPADKLSPEAGPPAAGTSVTANPRRASSAANSPIGFSRLPSTLGTVTNAEYGRQNLLT